MRIRKDKSRAKYISENLFDDSLVAGWRNDPEKAAVNSELRSTLESGLDIRSPDLCAAVVLRDIQGLSTEEAAKALNVSIASLKSRLYRARILLRKHLDRYFSLTLLPLPTPTLNPSLTVVRFSGVFWTDLSPFLQPNILVTTFA